MTQRDWNYSFQMEVYTFMENYVENQKLNILKLNTFVRYRVKTVWEQNILLVCCAHVTRMRSSWRRVWISRVQRCWHKREVSVADAGLVPASHVWGKTAPFPPFLFNLCFSNLIILSTDLTMRSGLTRNWRGPWCSKESWHKNNKACTCRESIGRINKKIRKCVFKLLRRKDIIEHFFWSHKKLYKYSVVIRLHVNQIWNVTTNS